MQVPGDECPDEAKLLNQSLRVRGWMIAGSSGRLLQKERLSVAQWHQLLGYWLIPWGH